MIIKLELSFLSNNKQITKLIFKARTFCEEMSKSEESKEGFIVNVPISPLYVLLSNLGLPIITQFGLKMNFKYWFKIGKYMPALPKAISSILPSLLTANNNGLLWRGVFGSFLIISGFKIQESGKNAMKEVDVVPPHGKPVKNLVTGGSFQYTRNPLYVGGMSIILGASLIFDNYLHLYGLIATYLYLQFLVIPREEQGLLKYFGNEFKNYCEKVPRWLISDLF